MRTSFFIFYDTFETEVLDAPKSSQTIVPKTIVKSVPDFQQLSRPLFGWMSVDIIEKTFEHTTQYERRPMVSMLKNVFRSPNPALNLYRCNEDVACNLVYSDVPANFDGTTAAVLFVGTSTKVTDANGIKQDNQFANTLKNAKIQRGAPNHLLSD
jgi:hypothetical protein